MPNATALLNDVLTFLCFLHADDVAPRGQRWLPPSALVRLNAQLLVHDEVTPSRATAAGKHGTTERETDRIRFVHFLCEAAGLVARTGQFLKPAPRVARWLDDPDDRRAAQLFAAAFPAEPDRAHDDLWRAYRLPGWQLASPSLELAPFFHVLREAPRDERIQFTTLLKLVPLPTLDDDPDAQPETILRGVLHVLDWFGAIEWRGQSAIRLTEWGAALLNRPDALPPVLPHTLAPSPATLKGERFEMDITGDWSTLYELSEYAELVAVKPRRRYHLDRTRIRRALERGTPLDHILRLLESAAGATLPGAIAEALHRWADDFGRVTLRRAVLLEVRDAQLLAELAETRTIRECIQRTLSPRAVIIRENRIPSLVRHLERRGLAPHIEFPRSDSQRSNDPAKRLRDYSTKRLFDYPTLAHLYLSVRLCHQLSDLIPPACRAPYSILLDLERQLDPRDRDLAAQLADETAASILQPRVLLPPQDDDRIPAPIATGIARTIQHAIAAGHPLEIVYTDARRATTTRVVEPYRLERRGRTLYLIAYSRLDRDERTFRLDRIQEMRNVE